MEDIEKVYAARTDEGKIAIINGTSCSELYCREMECAFPYCATFSGVEFNNEGEAKAVYHNLVVMEA